MSQNKLKLLLSNSAGFDALKEYVQHEYEETLKAVERTAVQVLFEPEKKNYALALHGKAQAWKDLLVELNKLETSTEGNK